MLFFKISSSRDKIKKNFKNISFCFFLVGFISGVFWYRQDLAPRPFIRAIYRNTLKDINKDGFRINKDYEKLNLTYSKYTNGVPLFLDRPYIDTVADEKLEGLFLIQITRHETKDIILETDSAITIYRIIPNKNDGLKKIYQITDIPVIIAGSSTTHLRVVKANFPEGKIILSPGGPIASSPILFSTQEKFPEVKVFLK